MESVVILRLLTVVLDAKEMPSSVNRYIDNVSSGCLGLATITSISFVPVSPDRLTDKCI